MEDVNKFCKIIDREWVDDTEFEKKHPEIIKHVKKIKGTIRSTGVHAAGIILADEDLTEGNRCCLINGKGNSQVINWDKNDCYRVGTEVN